MRKSLLIAMAALSAATPSIAAEYVASVFAANLNNPRGLAFGPDGSLYIAESGFVRTGGPTTDVIRGGGVSHAFHQSDTGSITRVRNGVQERIVTGLASIGSTTINEVTGPQDIAFGQDGTAYVVTGFVSDPNRRAIDLGVDGGDLGRAFTFTDNGVVTSFADFAAFEGANNPAGREVNSNPFHIAALPGGGLLATDAGSNTLLTAGANGVVSSIATFFARNTGGGFPSDSVPTGIAIGPDGSYFVAELTGFPFAQGSARIYRVSQLGEISIAHTGFTNLTDIAFDTDGTLLALELDSNGLATTGGTGRLLRIGLDGSRETLFSQGLVTPTGLAIGPDNAFYVANFSAATGIGQVLRISSAVPEPATWATMLIGFGAIGGAMRRQRRQRAAVTA